MTSPDGLDHPLLSLAMLMHGQARMQVDAQAAATARATAWQAMRDGFATVAERVLEAAADAADGGATWFALGAVRMARDDDQGARAAFLRAIAAASPASGTQVRRRLEFAAAEADRYAIFRILYDNFSNDFCIFTVPRAITPAERQGYAFAMDRACNRLGASSAETAALLDADAALNGDSYWNAVNRGHQAWVRGDRAAADAHYAAARAAALRDRLTPYHFNCGAMVWLGRNRAAELLPDPERKPVLNLHYSAVPPPDYVPDLAIMLGCDVRYFAFFPLCLFKIAQARRAVPGRAVVHLHLADATPAHRAAVADMDSALAALVPGLRLSLSDAPAAFRETAHYTCLRFLALPAVLARYRCPAVAMDIDALAVPGFFAALAGLAGQDLGLRAYTFDAGWRQVGGEPWSIGAHPTYVADSPLGRRFAAFLVRYIDAAYDPALPTNWTIDQCAIAQAYDLLVRGDAAARVANLAHAAPLTLLPDAFGGKQAMLEADGLVTPENFRVRLEAAVGSG